MKPLLMDRRNLKYCVKVDPLTNSDPVVQIINPHIKRGNVVREIFLFLLWAFAILSIKRCSRNINTITSSMKENYQIPH
jgi:hypothetical protein